MGLMLGNDIAYDLRTGETYDPNDFALIGVSDPGRAPAGKEIEVIRDVKRGYTEVRDMSKVDPNLIFGPDETPIWPMKQIPVYPGGWYVPDRSSTGQIVHMITGNYLPAGSNLDALPMSAAAGTPYDSGKGFFSGLGSLLTDYGLPFLASTGTAGISDAFYAANEGGSVADVIDRAIDPGGIVDAGTRAVGEQLPQEVRSVAPALGSIIGSAIYPVAGTAAGYGVGAKLAGQDNTSAGIGALTAAAAAYAAGAVADMANPAPGTFDSNVGDWASTFNADHIPVAAGAADTATPSIIPYGAYPGLLGDITVNDLPPVDVSQYSSQLPTGDITPYTPGYGVPDLSNVGLMTDATLFPMTAEPTPSITAPKFDKNLQKAAIKAGTKVAGELLSGAPQTLPISTGYAPVTARKYSGVKTNWGSAIPAYAKTKPQTAEEKKDEENDAALSSVGRYTAGGKGYLDFTSIPERIKAMLDKQNYNGFYA